MDQRRLGSRVFLTLPLLMLFSGCMDLLDDGKIVEEDGTSSTGGDAGNSAPRISGNPPPMAIVGDLYRFTPQAHDPDGDDLRFSIRNKPLWAKFDERTGTLSGVATQGNEGTYGEIEIAVNDGIVSDSLPEFEVAVTQTGDGTAVLSWSRPTQNADGTVLTDLTGFTLYYGNNQGSYPNSILIDNPDTTMHMVENLTPDEYFFVVTAVNSLGVESDYSNIATTRVN